MCQTRDALADPKEESPPSSIAVTHWELEERLRLERERAESTLVEQEHRLTHVIFNLYKFRTSKNAELVRAAWRAFIWRFFVPGPTAVAVAGTGILAVFGLLVALRANVLLDEQNKQIDIQNALIEAQRRSGLMFELTSIFEAIEREKLSAKTDEVGRFKISRLTLGRIVALSQSLRPYRALEISEEVMTTKDVSTSSFSGMIIRLFKSLGVGEKDAAYLRLAQRPLSPERGQLLNSLVAAGVDMQQVISARANFTFADLKYSRFVNVDLSEIKLENADLRHSILSKVNLTGAELFDADISETLIINSNLSGAFLVGSHMNKLTLSDSVLTLITIEATGDDLIAIDGRQMSPGPLFVIKGRITWRVSEESLWSTVSLFTHPFGLNVTLPKLGCFKEREWLLIPDAKCPSDYKAFTIEQIRAMFVRDDRAPAEILPSDP